MAKYITPFEDTTDLFNEKIREAGLDLVMNIQIITNNSLKDVVFEVKKCTPVEKFKSQDDINIFINEDIFDKLTPELQALTIKEALAWITYDSEKDLVGVDKPDFMAHTLVLQKESFEKIQVLRESIKSLFQAKKEAEDAEKAANKKGKK